MGEYSNFLLRHPEAKDIFDLAGKLEEAGILVYFNVEDYDLEDLESWALEEGASIWDDFDLLIETQTGELVDGMRAPVSAVFDGEVFRVLDAVANKEYINPDTQTAFEVFKNYVNR